MRRKTIIRLTFWVTMVLWFGGGLGCASHNESNRLGRAEPAPAFADSPPLEFTGEASLTGLDRSAWPTTRIEVMNNDAVTDPVYWSARQLNSRPSPRSTGRYPTVDSVLELHDQPETIRAHYLEIFTEPLHQLINIGAFPARLILKEPPGTRWHGPIGSYDRQPALVRPVELFPGVDTASEAAGDDG